MTVPTIADRQAEVIERFEAFADWQDRYREIIRAGRRLADFPEEHRTDQKKVQGCQSQVWLHVEMDDAGAVHYFADSDAHIVRGLLALVLEVYSGQPAGEIIATPPDFVDRLGLNEHLSQNRAFGLQAVLKQVKLYALALKTLRERGSVADVGKPGSQPA